MLGAIFLSVEIRACSASASPSQPQSASLTAPFRGMRPALWLRPVSALLRLPCGSLADAPPRRLMPPSGFALREPYPVLQVIAANNSLFIASIENYIRYFSYFYAFLPIILEISVIKSQNFMTNFDTILFPRNSF